MSQENVEIVRSTYEAFDRGDIDAVLSNADPGLVTHRADPEAATWHGPGGFLQAMADWTEGFDQFNARAEEFIDAGDRVIVRGAPIGHRAKQRSPSRSRFLVRPLPQRWQGHKAGHICQRGPGPRSRRA